MTRIPQNPGVYWIDGKEAKVIKAAEATVNTNKRRQVLAKLAPIPIVAGKGTLELQGAHSQNVFTNPEQEFFIQLSETQRFGICKLTPKGAVRVSVSAGGQSANGSGRLSRNSGGGVWRGQGNSGGCSGTWAAERRG